MAIVYKDLPAGHSECNLSVSVSGLSITVGAGTFRVMGERVLLEDQVFVVEPDDERVLHINGYLAEDRSMGGTVLLVDERFIDEDSYVWEEYKPLHRLFSFAIPPAISSLDEVDVRVVRRVKKEE